jgi:hypothetical protein
MTEMVDEIVTPAVQEIVQHAVTGALADATPSLYFRAFFLL